MPPIPNGVSSQTQRRLKGLDRNGGNESGGSPSISNMKGDTIHQDSIMTEKNAASTIKTQQQSPPRQALPRNCPQTPANRIPLADLIGNTEEAFNRPAKDITPDDHVYWQTGPRSSDPSSSIPSQQRGKKRAHSSSPAPLDLEKANQLSNVDGQSSFNFQNLHQLLKTPQADPALDLWNRYADSGIAKHEGGRHFSTLANLVSSSPQTPGTTSSKKGLRKAMSCGIEWPMSRSKKIKLDESKALRHMEETLQEPKDKILSANTAATSKVNMLMEKIQESLANAPAEGERHPSSSSPLPRRINTLGELAQPPKLRPEAANDNSPTRKVDMSIKGSTSEELVGPITRAQVLDDDEDLDDMDGSSDYGDNVFDDEFVAIADNKSKPQQVDHTPKIATGSDDDDFEALNFEDLVAQIDEGSISSAPPTKGQAKAVAQSTTANLLDDDPFGDDDDDEELWNTVSGTIAQVEMPSTAKEDARDMSQKNFSKQAIKRYLIVDVADSQYEDRRGRIQLEKVLSVEDEKTSQRKVILLRQCWLETRAAKGGYVHLVGNFDHAGHCVVDDAQNFVITHPDILISATGVADSFQCLRRSVLADRVKATSEPNPPQVYGSLLHEIFQEALQKNRWDDEWLNSIIDRIISENLEALYQINVDSIVATEHLRSKMPELKAWASVFISARPKVTALAEERNGARVNVSINKLLEVEEHVWSPMYGLKGNVDATVQVVIRDGPLSKERTLTVPFELKTGRRDTSESHRAQTALYTLLLQDRYDVNVMFGLLYYIETSRVFSIPAVRNEIRHMIVQRNELASYVYSKLDLPPMVQKPYMCNSCYAKTSCLTYHRLKEDGDGTTSGLGDKFDTAVAHLTKADQQWFQKWDDLITKEEKDMMKFRRELWTMNSSERQALGRCFGGVIIDPGTAQENRNRAKIDRFRYTFIKRTPEPGFSFNESQLTLGEPVVISDEDGHFALAMGYITNVRRDRISVAVDRRLHNVRTKEKNFHAANNQTFRGIMEVLPGGTQYPRSTPEEEQAILYRIDKDEFNSGLATIRNNLIRMMEKDLFRARELRQLIINLEPPTFKPTSSAYTLNESSSQALNIDQRQAIEKVMSAQDYALVLGMPGTGKTTTIAHIIRALVRQGKTVLLNSYTHTAVDNILLKIKDDKIKVLRLGSLGKIHPEVQTFADLAAVPKKSVAELEESYIKSQVVATTCLGVNHPIFNQRIFDYCIVDEASQITLPTCLSGLRMARRFVLVGDHYQLPPLVQNKEAAKGGLDISLFKTLSDQHPSSVVNLEHQYRMNADIMLLSNTLIYSGRLKCGTPQVANRVLNIPHLESGLSSYHHSASKTPTGSITSVCSNDRSCWLRQSLAPEHKVLFLNTDPMGSTALEFAQGARITNMCEANLCTQLVTTLVASGIAPNEIGVITFYRSQLALLRQKLGHRYAGVEMHTADKFQGRDKEVIILSCVRNNSEANIGDLLKDWRRVNVALTRARSKMVIIGSSSTLAKSQNDVLERFIALVESKAWVLNLPKDALGSHVFDTSTQFTAESSWKSPRKPMKQEMDASPITDTTSPLREIGGNSRTKKPGLRQAGKVGKLNMERFLDTRPLMKDIMNDVV